MTDVVKGIPIGPAAPNIEVRAGKVYAIPYRHEHNYHGPHCPVLTTTDGKCLVITTPGLKTCCEPCMWHGPNCTIGICLSCWLYGNNGGSVRTTFHHFMPGPPAGPKKKKENRWK